MKYIYIYFNYLFWNYFKKRPYFSNALSLMMKISINTVSGNSFILAISNYCPLKKFSVLDESITLGISEANLHITSQLNGFRKYTVTHEFSQNPKPQSYDLAN